MSSRRVAIRPLLKVGFVVLALAFCVYGVLTEWSPITDALSRMSWPALAGALLTSAVGLFVMMLAWRTLVTGFGSHLSIMASVRVMFVGQLGKYVPGSVWAMIGQTELARDYGVPREVGAAATVVAMAVTLTSACAVTALTLPLTSSEATHHYWWAMLLVIPMIGCLHPKVITTVLNRVLKIVRRPPLPCPIRSRYMVIAVGWTMLGWLLWGLQLYFLVRTAGGAHTALLPLCVGSYALAWAVGFLVIVSPGGLGAREAAMVVALSPVMPDKGGPLVVALASRVVMTVADLVGAGIGFTVRPSREPSGTPSTPVRDQVS